MAKKQKRVDWFVYRTKPFRPLYSGMHFHEPKRAPRSARLALFYKRDIARSLAALNGAEYADFRDYVRISGGGKPFNRSIHHSLHTPTLDDIA